MSGDRRLHWEGVLAEHMAIALNPAEKTPRRNLSAMWAGQAAHLLDIGRTGNPFDSGSVLAGRWRDGWDLGSRIGDPAASPDPGRRDPARPTQERHAPARRPQKFPTPFRTHADFTHPED